MTPRVRHTAQGWYFTDPAVLEMRERKSEARKAGWATRRAAAKPLVHQINRELGRGIDG